MANSTHAHLRYNILDYCFRYKSYSFEELLAHVNESIAEFYPGEGISTRTLREDLKVFRNKENGFGAPLPEKVRILKYANPNFSIAQRPLLAYEQYVLNAAIQLLERFDNHPKYNKLSEALIRFQDEEEIDTSQVLFYDHNEEYKGIRFLKPLYLAIKNQQVLRVRYQGFKDEEEDCFEFHPQVLKQYNRRWFVFGLNSTKNIKRWSIPLDERLIDFESIEDREYVKSDVNWEAFFRTMVGVVRPAEAEVVRVELKFYNGREQYFKTKPFHADFEEYFEIEKQDQVWFETILNKELVQQILSYGSDVQVLVPIELVGMLETQVKKLHQLYNL